MQSTIGKGRVVYVPEIIPSTVRHSGEATSSQYWSLPANQEVLLDSIVWAIGERPAIQMQKSISPYLTVELVHQEAKNRLILHLLNYDHARNSPIKDIPVEVAVPGDHKVKRIQMLTPDLEGEEHELDWTGDKVVLFTIPSLTVYTIAILDLE